MAGDKGCNHDGSTSRRFGGAVTCDLCSLIIGYWSAGQPQLIMKKENK